MSSSFCRKKDRSRGVMGGGPPVGSPAPRRSASRSRIARASPMLSAVKGLAGGPDRQGPRLQAPAGEHDVGRDHDIAGLYMIRDPVIGRVEAAAHHLEHDPRVTGDPHPGVGHQGDRQPVPVGDAVDLLFDRARVGVHKNVQHRCFPPNPFQHRYRNRYRYRNRMRMRCRCRYRYRYRYRYRL